jgi:CRISPR-associated protein Csm5
MKLLLETLTPVHIGSGESIEPYEYVISDKFYRINLGKFISSLDVKDRDTFLKLSSSDMIQTRKFIKEKANLPSVTEYSMNVDSEVREIYENKMDDPNNQLSIQIFIKTSSRPFIPGSSVKGAIRTALLFSMADKPIKDTHDIEKNVFKFENPKDDPFRVLKISDSLPVNLSDMIVYTVKTYAKKDKFAASGYNILIEGTNSDYTDKTVRISHDINIDRELNKQNKFDINIDKITSSCNEFYQNVIQSELNFYNSSKTSYAYDRYEMLEEISSHLEKEKSFILRLGWGSGYDSVTINLAKKIPDPKISRRLIHGEFPLGWVKAKILVK